MPDAVPSGVAAHIAEKSVILPVPDVSGLSWARQKSAYAAELGALALSQ